MEKEIVIKKNILDLHFQKHLTILTISIMIFFTYLIAIILATLTKQIEFDNSFSISILILFSIIILGPCLIFLFNSLFHIKNIPRILTKLN